MNNNRQNSQLLKLQDYLRNLSQPANDEQRRKIGEDLLTLIFAYARSKAGLNIRLHRQESEVLLFFTVEELFAKKGKDPDLNDAYNLLEKLDPTDTATRETILNLAERVLKKRNQILKRISKRPRVRKEHPFKQIVREMVEDYFQSNHIDIRKKAISEGCRLGMIDEVEEDNQNIIFSKHIRARDVAFPTIRDWISNLKDKKVSRS
ncbi:hypothetical protein G6681_05495 [Polynucleobacter paneuropaeus]|nr:hypothetical protein G6681_05495 [Polynucleobacter paneuropaeus]